MILSTARRRRRRLARPRTPQIEGHTIREYKGVVTGETIIGANIVKDFFAGIRDIVGGRAGAYEKVLREAKDTSHLFGLSPLKSKSPLQSRRGSLIQNAPMQLHERRGSLYIYLMPIDDIQPLLQGTDALTLKVVDAYIL